MERRKNIITMLVIVLAVLIILAGVAVASVLDTAKAVKENPISAFKPDTSPLVLKEPQQQNDNSHAAVPKVVDHDLAYDGKYYNKKESYVNIVLLGFDDMQDRKEDGANTDSIMVFQIDFDTADVNVISIPRDTWTLINEYDDSGNWMHTYNTKINAAFSAAARKQDQYPNVLATIENLLQSEGLFDLDIDYYCSIDIKDIPQICKVLGGVKITLDYTIPGVGVAGETVLLDEVTAQVYLRDRATGNGDITRAGRHQKFMVALAKRIKALGGKKAALTLYDDAIRYVKTNLSLEQVAALATLADEINVDAIKLYTVPGKVGGANYERPGGHFGDYRSVYLVNYPMLTNLVLDLFYNEVK